MFATSRRWLEDGKQIKIEHAPTPFGPVSVLMKSELSAAKVTAQLELPTRNPVKSVLLRARVPDGWKIVSARAGGSRSNLNVDSNGTVDISGLRGTVTVEFRVEKRS